MNQYIVRYCVLEQGKIVRRSHYKLPAEHPHVARLTVARWLCREGLDFRARITSVKQI